MRTYRTRQNVKVCAVGEEGLSLWDAIKPAVYFVLGFLVLYAVAVGVML